MKENKYFYWINDYYNILKLVWKLVYINRANRFFFVAIATYKPLSAKHYTGLTINKWIQLRYSVTKKLFLVYFRFVLFI